MPTDVEIEVRFIGLDRAEMERRLLAVGANKESDSLLREWVFAHEAWAPERKRVRVRDDGKNVWVTYKAHPGKTWEIDGTEEVEIGVSSSADAIKILEKIGVPLLRHQEKKRIKYKLGDATVDMDFWPKIPMVLEIEAPSKKRVMEVARQLGLPWEDAIFVDQKVLHEQYYGIDLNAMKEYKF